MTTSLRTIVLDALKRWGCLYREVEPNRIRAFISTGSPLERVCDRTGEVTIALSEFETAPADSSDRFDFVTGSIYLTRLLRELQSGPAMGSLEMIAPRSLPATSAVAHLMRSYLPETMAIDRCTPGLLERKPALAFHFVLLLRGLHFVESFFTVTIDVASKAPLDQVTWEAPYVPASEAGPDLDQVGECYLAAVALARNRIVQGLEQYREKAAPEIEQTVHTIQRMVRKEIEDRRRRASRVGPAAVEAECDVIRESARKEIESIRQQGFARSTDLTLVGVTCEWRSVAEYLVRLELPEGRMREIGCFFDCATGSLRAPICEGCGLSAALIRPGEPPCSHLLCVQCHPGTCGRHAVCARCSATCDVCRKPVCTRCEPQERDGCEHILCEKHETRCFAPDCKQRICPKCTPRCGRCRKRACHLHIIQCPICNAAFCPDHVLFGQHGRRCNGEWVRRRTKLFLDLAKDSVDGSDSWRERAVNRGIEGVDVDRFGEILREYRGSQGALGYKIREWFQPVEASFKEEKRVLESLHRLIVAHDQQRLDRRWVKLRTELLLDLAGDCLLYGFAGVGNRMLGQEGFDSVDVGDLHQILRGYFERDEGIRPRIRAWFEPVMLSHQDEDRVLDGLLRLELEDDAPPPLAAEEDEAAPEARALKQDPRIVEYGALPSRQTVEERAQIWSDEWLIRAGEIIPGYDEELARSAFFHEVTDASYVSAFERTAQAEFKDRVRRVLKTLTPREELVLKMRFGFGDGTEHSVDEVGRSFNVTGDRIRQIEAKALRKLRHPSRAGRLLPFLEK